MPESLWGIWQMCGVEPGGVKPCGDGGLSLALGGSSVGIWLTEVCW